MIVKLVGKTDGRILFDYPNGTSMARSLGIPDEKLEVEAIDLGQITFWLYFCGNLNIVIFSDETFEDHLYVSDKVQEAVKIFREGIICYKHTQQGDHEECEEVEGLLAKKYGLLNDLKTAYRLLEELGGEVDIDQLAQLNESKHIGLGLGYPYAVFEQDSADYLFNLMMILEGRGFLEGIEEHPKSAWRIIRKLDL